MTSEVRRKKILETLEKNSGPCNATNLAAEFGVSRQVIVADVALLRASGNEITATPRGYVMNCASSGLIRRIACCHTNEDAVRELNIIVDNGCIVADVVVEHPIYGELIGSLQLKSRYDVAQFACSLAGTRPLSLLTDGIHLHTIVCPDEGAYERVCAALSEAGILLEDT